MAESNIRSTSTTMAANEPMREPEMRSQNESNCWQIANQFALTLPLCAKYTIAAAADAPAVTRASIACKRIAGDKPSNQLLYMMLSSHIVMQDDFQVFNMVWSGQRGDLTASRKIKSSLLYLALLLMMCTIDNGSERVR
jgi:hypothetical protein